MYKTLTKQNFHEELNLEWTWHYFGHSQTIPNIYTWHMYDNFGFWFRWTSCGIDSPKSRDQNCHLLNKLWNRLWITIFTNQMELWVIGKYSWCRGVVGYHVSLTHWRSPVRVRATPIFAFYFLSVHFSFLKTFTFLPLHQFLLFF